MGYLLDTHCLIWMLLTPEKLSVNQRKILSDKTEQKIFSTLSIWEISLKFALGKLELGGYKPEAIVDEAMQVGLQVLSPTAADLASGYRLPAMPKHKDPFDRMLAWQAIRYDLTLLSGDSKLQHYQAQGLKLQP